MINRSLMANNPSTSSVLNTAAPTEGNKPLLVLHSFCPTKTPPATARLLIHHHPGELCHAGMFHERKQPQLCVHPPVLLPPLGPAAAAAAVYPVRVSVTHGVDAAL